MSLIAIVAGVVATLKTSNLDENTFKLVKAQLEHLNAVVEKTSGNTSANEVDELKEQHKAELKMLEEFKKEQHEIALKELKEQHDIALKDLKEQHRVSQNKKTRQLTRENYLHKRELDRLREELEKVCEISLLQKKRRERRLTDEEKEKRTTTINLLIRSDSKAYKADGSDSDESDSDGSDSDAYYTDGSVSGFLSDIDQAYSEEELEWWVSAKEDKEMVKLTMENGKSEHFVKIGDNKELRYMLDEDFHYLYCNWSGQCIEWYDGIAYWYGRVSKKDGWISIDRNVYRAWRVAKGIREMKSTGITIRGY